MRFKRITYLAFIAIFGTALFSCGQDNSDIESETNSSTSNSSQIIEIEEPQIEEFQFKDSITIDEHLLTITFVNEANAEKAFSIQSTNTNINEAVSIIDTQLSINKIDEYSLSGDYYGGLEINIADDGDDLILNFNGLNISSATACPLKITSEVDVEISAKKDTENHIYDYREAQEDFKSAIFADCDLKMKGTGSLEVLSLNNNGIHTKDDLTIQKLTLTVKSVDNALKGNDSVTIKSGTIGLIATQGDGIKTSNSSLSSKNAQKGDISILGGNITIYAACDGIDAANNVVINEEESNLNLSIYTNKYSEYSEEIISITEKANDVKTTDSSQPAQRGPGGPGGRPGGFGPGGMNDGNKDKSDYSCKGIKSDNEINISSGNIYIKAYDDAIHTNNDNELESGASPTGNINIDGGILSLYSNDDAMHADGILTINDGVIDVTNAYEGLEGSFIIINGGQIAIVSTDDGLNSVTTAVTNDNPYAITLNGGYLYVYAGGDGIDANVQTNYKGILFNGTKVVVINTSGGNSCIDTERGYTYQAGVVLGVMSSGGMTNEATVCSNFSTIGTIITISNASSIAVSVNDENTVAVKLPKSMSSFVVYLGSSAAKITNSTLSIDYNNDGVWFK